MFLPEYIKQTDKMCILIIIAFLSSDISAKVMLGRCIIRSDGIRPLRTSFYIIYDAIKGSHASTRPPPSNGRKLAPTVPTKKVTSTKHNSHAPPRSNTVKRHTIITWNNQTVINRKLQEREKDTEL